MRALSASERRWLIWASALLLLFTLVPLALAAARTPAGYVFGGFVYEARDGDSYVGKTMQGVEGHWLYHDPYTSEKEPASLIYAPYLFLGQVDRVLHVPVPLLLQLVRLGLSGALLAGVYLLCAECFADPGRRRLAFLLALLGGGLGFLGIAHANVFGYHYVSLDIGVSGSSGLDSINLAPHTVLACLGSTWLAILWLRNAREPTARRLAGGLVWVLLVSTAYPQLAAMWALVGLLAWALRPKHESERRILDPRGESRAAHSPAGHEEAPRQDDDRDGAGHRRAGAIPAEALLQTCDEGAPGAIPLKEP